MRIFILPFLFSLLACGPDRPVQDPERLDDSARLSEEVDIILSVANQAYFEELTVDAGLDISAADSILVNRPFENLAELDWAPYIGAHEIDLLLAYGNRGVAYTCNYLETIPIEGSVRINTCEAMNVWTSECGAPSARDVVLEFVAPGEGNYYIEAYNADFPVTIATYERCGEEAIFCNDEHRPGRAEASQYVFDANETFKVVVSGVSAEDCGTARVRLRE